MLNSKALLFDCNVSNLDCPLQGDKGISCFFKMPTILTKRVDFGVALHSIGMLCIGEIKSRFDVFRTKLGHHNGKGKHTVRVDKWNLLMDMLGPQEIRSKCIRRTGKPTSKGYLLADFDDAFARYSSVQPAPELKGTELQDLFHKTLKQHGNDETATMENIISDLQKVLPEWTFHAECPSQREAQGRAIKPRETIKEIENRLKTRSRPKRPKKISGTLPLKYKPSSKEPFMNDQMLEYFNQKILIWRNQLQRKSSGTIQYLHEGNSLVQDTSDHASIEAERLLKLRKCERAKKLIVKIDEALDRIDTGTYGYCEETGEQISLTRLELQPTTTLSIEAQERHERIENTHLSKSD